MNDPTLIAAVAGLVVSVGVFVKVAADAIDKTVGQWTFDMRITGKMRKNGELLDSGEVASATGSEIAR